MRIVLILTATLVFFVNPLAAQQPVVNEELKSLIQAGFAYYPDLKEQEEQVHISERRIDLMQTYHLPTLTGNASYSYINPVGQVTFPVGPGQFADIKFQPNDNINAYLGLSYSLLDFGKIRANIDKSKEELNVSKHTMELSQLSLASQIGNIYYSIVFLKKTIAIQDSILNYLRENMKVIESRFRHGDALKVDVMNVQALIDNENNRKIELQNQLRRNYTLLRYASGKDSATNANEFDFTYDTGDLEAILAEAGQNNPQFQLVNDRIKIAESELRLSWLQRMPTLNLTATTGFRNGYQPDIYKLRFNYLIGGVFSVPIYAGGRLNLQTEISGRMVRMSEMKRQTLENNYRKDIQQALNDISSLKDRLKNVESQIEQARAAQALTASRYKNGTATYLDLTSASANFQRAHSTKLQYQYQLCQSYIELSRLAGIKYW